MKILRGPLWRSVCHLIYFSGIGPLSAWMWRRHSPDSWTVLGYHRVGSPVVDGGPDHVAPDRFRAHLAYVRKRYAVVTVGEALNLIRKNRARQKPMLSITFDDGYRDNVTIALPLLRDAGCRATLYPTLESIVEGRSPWTHRLAGDLMRYSQGPGTPVPNDVDDLPEILRKHLYEVRALSGKALAVRIDALIGEVKCLPDAERREICRLVEEMAPVSGGGQRETLTAAELREWKAAGMEVGSHTSAHPVLSRLDASDRRADLTQSRAGLEKLLGVPVVHLAYPNGRVGDFDDATMEDVRAAGFVSALTTLEGFNDAGRDPFQIRRISVGNDSLPVFATRVSPLFTRARAWLHARGARGQKTGPSTASTVRPLRVAFIGGRGIGSAYSGIERYYEELGSRLVSRGHRVLAYCRPHFSPGSPVFRGLEVRRLPTIRSKHLETLVHTILATVDVCFRRVDLVQFHALGSSPFAWIPRLAGKRTIVSVRGLDWQREKWGWLARNYLRFCEMTSMYCPNATAVVSKTLQTHFEGRFGRSVRYIPNGVARTVALPPDGIRQWGLGQRDYFLYAGRLSPEKGLDTLIEAHSPIPGIRLAIAGGSSYSDGYMERLRSQATEKVVFTGLLTGTILQEIYSNALAFILPSRMEGLSVALLEAMSYGIPVIASDIPENRELVDECGGYLFRLDDAEDLRRVLKKVAGQPEEARRVGERARQIVRARFDWDRIARETAEFYVEVMQGAKSIPASHQSRTPPMTAQLKKRNEDAEPLGSGGGAHEF